MICFFSIRLLYGKYRYRVYSHDADQSCTRVTFHRSNPISKFCDFTLRSTAMCRVNLFPQKTALLVPTNAWASEGDVIIGHRNATSGLISYRRRSLSSPNQWCNGVIESLGKLPEVAWLLATFLCYSNIFSTRREIMYEKLLAANAHSNEG